MNDDQQQPLPEGAALRAIAEGVEAETGDSFFQSLVKHVAIALGVRYVFVSELTRDGEYFRTLAVWGGEGWLPNLEVRVAGTPCEAVLSGEMSHHPADLQKLFPADVGLVEWQAESYCGVPLLDPDGRVVGHLAIFDVKPMRDPRGVAILRIFAARARAEIFRQRAYEELRESRERLAGVLQSAMDAIVTFDEGGTIELFNDAAEKVFGCGAADAIGGPLDRFLTDGLRRALDDAVATLGRGGRVPFVWAPGGLAARAADGREFPIEATISAVEIARRRLYTLILRDVEERRRAEDELRKLHRQNEYLQEEIRETHNLDEIVGQSAALSSVLDELRLVADTDSTVLILGETGTGKEMVARAVHSASRRRDRPLIKVNCAALPTGLIESELFGHERGAFTGATEKRVGRFELAHGGTIFLDEIGEVPLDVQVKLLRVLQEQEFERVGSNRTIRSDVRVIAATNRDLTKMVADGTFRTDLYYRLNVFPLALPPLRERKDDVPLLVHYFVGRFAAKIGRPIRRVPRDAMDRLVAYPWPGNVRELENVIERAVILSAGPELAVDPFLLPGVAPPPAPAATAPPARRPEPEPDDPPAALQTLEQVERRHILSVLKQARWRIDGPGGAAQVLSLNPSTLRSRIKKLGIQRSVEDARSTPRDVVADPRHLVARATRGRAAGHGRKRNARGCCVLSRSRAGTWLAQAARHAAHHEARRGRGARQAANRGAPQPRRSGPAPRRRGALSRRGRGLTLDLTGVSFASSGGVALLRRLEARGVTLDGCSGFLCELLRGPAEPPADGDPLADERRLVAALRRGDEPACDAFVRRNLARMLATARRMLGNDDDARDVVQEAFQAAFRAIGSFSG